MMYNPPHPGEVLGALCLKPLGLSVTRAAKALGVARKTLSQLLNGHMGVSPTMAIRLAFATNTTPEAHTAWEQGKQAYPAAPEASAMEKELRGL